MSVDWKAYLTEQGVHFDDEQLSHFPSSPASLNDNIVSVNDQYRVIRISGADRQKFLQGQISTQMEQLSPLHHATGVACTAKGRMYSSFRIINAGDSYLLSMHRSVVESTLEALKKYAVFFKVELLPVENVLILGFNGEDIHNILLNNTAIDQLPAANDVVQTQHQDLLLKAPGTTERYELWLNTDHLQQWWPSLSDALFARSAVGSGNFLIFNRYDLKLLTIFWNNTFRSI